MTKQKQGDQQAAGGSAALVKYNFHGDELDVVTSDGAAQVGIRCVCEALGVSYSRQLKKLKADPSICVAIMATQIEGDDQRREIACINLRDLPLWLATIHPSKVKVEVRPKLIDYKRECAEVLADHFFGARSLVSQSTSAELVTIRTRTDEILTAIHDQHPATVEGLAMALVPLLDHAIVQATAPLAARIAEQRQMIVVLTDHVTALGGAVVRSHDLAIDTNKRLREIAGRDGRITPEDANHIRGQIEILTQMHLRLGKEKTKGSEKSAKSGIVSVLFEVIKWNGAGKKIDNILAKDVPVAKNFLDYEVKKARRELAQIGRVVAHSTKTQRGLFDNKPN